MIGETEPNHTKAVFATPDREALEFHATQQLATKQEAAPIAPNSVTPPESSTREQLLTGGKQVRFDPDKTFPEPKNQGTYQLGGSLDIDSKGLVSRRGGRFGSPGKNRPKDAVAVYKTYRSPQRKRVLVKEESDAVPSLCSSKSGELTSTSSTIDIAPNGPLEMVNVVKATETLAVPTKRGRPNSISVDPSLMDTTSPLTSSPAVIKLDNRAMTPPKRIDLNEDKRLMHSPPNKTVAILPGEKRKTPTRSPLQAGFHSLPSLHDAKLNSPCGTFLSPFPPSPSAYTTIAVNPSFDDDYRIKRFEEEKSPKTRDQERARSVATPTDFAVDFGKGHKSSPSFDASNVLAWLQSPTINGLFSPGGLSSAHGTPRGFGGPRTPRTPTVSTSFFFSDVASLPRHGEFASPKPGAGTRQGGAAGMSSMICISPLASSKRKHGDSRTNTPMNYKDVFSSPRHPSTSIKPRNMPLLGNSPSKGSRSRTRSDASLDAVDMAERDLMEDEDLSVLLQLASHSRGNTPRGKKADSGAHVFRSPRDRANLRYGRDDGLQIPMIGNTAAGSMNLSRKSKSTDDANAEDFHPPPLDIRSTSSGGSREMYTRGQDEVGPEMKAVLSNEHATHTKPDGWKKKENNQPSSKHTLSKRVSKKLPHPVYTMSHPHYHHPDAPPYYRMPPSMPPGGSMRVVVGVPPPMRGKKGAMSPPRLHSSPPRHPHHMEGPYGAPYPGSYPPPPPGAYSSYPPPPYMPGGGPPPYGHYPPPISRHMPMYAAQHPPNGPLKGGSKKAKTSKPIKGINKRPTPIIPVKVLSSAQKNSKKSPIVPSSAKKKCPVQETGESIPTTTATQAVNDISCSMNDKAAALAAAILRGVTMRPSGKWQAQLYYAGKSRYIGVFDTREKAALAYEIAREKLKADNKTPADQSAQTLKATENAVNAARKAAFEGVNEKDPRVPSK